MTAASSGLELLRRARRVLLLSPPWADTVEVEQQRLLVSSQPIGLLHLATWLREQGAEVLLLDCLGDPAVRDRWRGGVRRRARCGNFEEERRTKPIHHFGLDPDALAARLRDLDPPPDLVAVSEQFTWHLESVRETIAVCRRVLPASKVILGGIMPTLCPREAGELGADALFSGVVPGRPFLPTALDLLPERDVDFLSLVRGCPNRCEYCVTPALCDRRVLARPPEEAFAELRAKQAAFGTRTFVFYDDYPQYKQSRHLDPFLDLVIAERPGVHLDFQVGFAARRVTAAFARRLRDAGVGRVTVALETIDEARGREMSRPQKIDEFRRAVAILKDAGYAGERLKVFYLIGLPDSTTTELLRGIGFLLSLGVTPVLTTYALTPRSGYWARYVERVADRSLEDLAPCLWPFAHPGMQARELDAVYRFFNERYYPLERIRASRTTDPLIVRFQKLLRAGGHLPQNW